MDLLRYLDETTNRALHARRAFLSHSIREQCDSIVQYGILKGFRVPTCRWAEIVSSAYILGTYEVQVCAILDTLRGPRKVLVDLGGADGVFGVGLVEVGAFDCSIIFEMREELRQSLVHLAQSRGLAEKVAVFGEATHDFVSLIEARGIAPRDCVILCDIEGAEFDLFDDATLATLQGANIIIELHDFLLSDPARCGTAIADLKRAAERYFDVIEIKDGLRDIRDIPLLRNLSDWDSWLLCVEARYRMMSWLWLRPRGSPALSPAALDALVIDYQRRIFTGNESCLRPS